MDALVLDGGRGDGSDTAGVVGRLVAELSDADWGTDVVTLRDEEIAPCKGCFGCWITSPGVCVTDDTARRLARSFMQADLVVFVTPVTFGGYSSELKKVLDRMIGNISPFFSREHGETHHKPRYERSPTFLAVGIALDPAVSDEADIFRRLVARNATNLHHPRTAAGVVEPDGSVTRLLQAVGVAVPGDDRVEGAADLELGFMPGGDVPEPDEALGNSPHRALLLVGSPRRNRSTSAVLGGHLLDRLGQRGVETDTLHVLSVLAEGPAGVERLSAAVQDADLVVLASPLYVDSLPSRVMRAMEELYAVRSDPAGSDAAAGDRAFVAIVNSGFPEASQCAVALSIAHIFARRMGLRWAGGLALGGGGAFDGRPLDEVGGLARKAKAALDLAADALAEGAPVPQEARELMSSPGIPAWTYRMIGDRGWRKAAAARGTQDRLWDKPYAEIDAS